MTSLENEPHGQGKVLTGKDYLEDLKLHLDVLDKIKDNELGKKAIPRRKKIYRIAESIITDLNQLEMDAEVVPNGPSANKLTSLYYYYGVDNVEDLAMLMAQQYDADARKQEMKSLVKGVKGMSAPVVDFAKVKPSGTIIKNPNNPRDLEAQKGLFAAVE